MTVGFLETRIHPTAVVHPTARLGVGVSIGPYTVVAENTEIGDRTTVGSSCSVGPNVRMGCDNAVHSHAAVGGDPQDKLFRGEQTWLEVGEGNHFREFVTINRGTTKGDGFTRIGHKNLFMACSHVAHDCFVGDSTVFANNVLLAGHVYVEDGAILNGAVGVQQFTTIGRFSYVGGLTRVVHDVPPFMIVEGNPAKVRKVNIVGLQRAGFAESQIDALREAHRAIFRSARPQTEILDELVELGMTAEVAVLVEFLRRTERGAHGRAREKP